MTAAAASPRPHFPKLKGDIAIIGMACTYPGARHMADFWQNILSKYSAIREVPKLRWDPDLYYDPDPAKGKVYSKLGAYLGETFSFNPGKHGTMPRAIEGAEPDQFLMLRAVYEAMADAGYRDKKLDGKRCEIIIGRGNYLGAGLSNLVQRGMITEQTLQIVRALRPDMSAEDLRQVVAEWHEHLSGFGPDTAPGIIPNITTGRVTNRLDFMGPNYTVDAACASSLIACDLAIRDLLTGSTDFALVGGIHIFTNVPFLQVFSALGALSRTGACRPFSAKADGVLSGEGVGVLVIKRLADAERDGDRIYALIKGVGVASDGRAMGVTAPRLEGEILAVERAYEMAELSPKTIQLLEGHGTGTGAGDETELKTLRAVFGPRDREYPQVALGSVKSMIGHAMPAAGAASLIKATLALYERTLPPTLNCEEPHELLTAADSRFYANTETRPWVHGDTSVPRRAAVDAFGFGGINAHLILEEYQKDDPHQRPTHLRNWECELLVVEADTRAQLAGQMERLRDYCRAVRGVPLRDVAFTLNTALEGKAQRLAIVATSLEDLASKLERFAPRVLDASATVIKDTKGVYYFAEPLAAAGKVAWLFPGEGAQYVNMMGDLFIAFTEVQEAFDAADRAAQSPTRYPPSIDIFPPPTHSQEEMKAAEARLWKIERATEAVLTADGAMMAVLEKLEIKPDMIAGHSAGEWAGMVAAGILDLKEYLSSLNRLDAMYRRVQEDQSIPRAAMLAVGADRDKVARLVHEIDCELHIANDNCPHQVVIVVDVDAADRVARHLLSKNIFVEKLPYDRGYHTPIFTYICEPLREYFSSLTMRRPRIDLYSCTTAKRFPTRAKEILALAADTFARPILFRDMIETMHADGARVFIEVGPRGNMSGFVDDILRGKPHAAIPTNLQRRSGIASLMHALGQMAAHHVPMKLNHLYRRRACTKLSWDAAKDSPIPEEQQPGTVQVPLHYPIMKLLRPQKPLPSAASAAPAPAFAPTAQQAAAPAAAPFAAPVESWGAPPAAPQPASDAGVAPGWTSELAIADELAGLPPLAPVAAPPAAGALVAGPGASSPIAGHVMAEHLRLMDSFLQAQGEILSAFFGSGQATPPAHQPLPAPMPLGPEEFAAQPSAADAIAAAPQAPPDPISGGLPPAPPPPDWAVALPSAYAAASAATPQPAVAGPHPAAASPPAHPVGAASRADRGFAAGAAFDLAALLIQIVSDKTGYPPEMLNLDLDMEAELGIDSIKRIEILGTLQKQAPAEAQQTQVDMEQVAKLKTLRQVIDMLGAAFAGNRAGGGPAAGDGSASASGQGVPDASALPLAGKVVRYTPDSEIVVHRAVHRGEDLYLEDHRFGIVLSADDPLVGGLPVVPLTVSIEMMAEVASLLRPGLKVIGLRDVTASKWIDIETPDSVVNLEIWARCKPGADTVTVELRDLASYRPDKPRLRPSPVCQGTIVFGSEYPASPAPEAHELINAKKPLCTAQEMYDEHRMFHGPMFQGVKSLDRVGENGLLAQLETLPRHNVLKSTSDPQFHIDPFFFDAVGQLVGYWPVEYYRQGFVLFPIRVRELIQYRPTPPPGERFDVQLRIREISERTLRTDLDVIQGGRLWLRVIGWEDWRFYWEPSFYDFWRHPNRHIISTPIELPLPPGNEDAECYRMEPFGEIQSNIWENLYSHLIFSRQELAQYHAMPRNERRTQWMFGRSAAKDAVRAWVAKRDGLKLFPSDVIIETDERGRPFARGAWVGKVSAVPKLSISHKGLVAVAVASSAEIGLDLERVETREASFETAAFDEREREMLRGWEGASRDEWVTRLWCAKEAAAKAAGVGMDHGPGTMVARGVDPDSGCVTVAYGERLAAGAGPREIPVHSRRHGEFVMAIAILEGNGNGRDNRP